MAGDALTSAGFGEAGRGIVKGLGALVSPVVRPVVKTLMDKGVTLTPGQIAGGAWQKIEDGVQGSVLGLGDMVASAKKRGIDAFNRAAASDALAPIGAALPDHVPTGHEAVAYVKGALSHAYDSVLGAMHAKVDPALQQAVSNTVQNASTGVSDLSGQVQKLWATKVAPYFDASGTMAGGDIKDVDRTLRGVAKPYRNSPDGVQQAFAGHVDDLRQALKDAAARASGPDLVAQLGAVDKAYAKYVPLRGAAKTLADGIFTPTGLDTAVRVADQSVGKGNKATGQALMQDLSNAGRSVLPSTVPDSGTARRLAIQAAFGAGAAGGGAGLGLLSAAPAGLGLGALASLAYTKPGQAAATRLLTGRQGAGFVAARGMLDGAAPYAGRIAAGSVPALLRRPGQ